MASLVFDPRKYGGGAPLANIIPGELFWWNNAGVVEIALRLVTAENDSHWRVVHFPKGKLPKYVVHQPNDQNYYLFASGAAWRVDGVPSGPMVNGVGAAGTICVSKSANNAVLCATSKQGVVQIDLKTYDVVATTTDRAPFKHWAVGTMDVNNEFFPFYER
jgi:hypothetical protein